MRLSGAELVPLALHEEARLGRPLQHAASPKRTSGKPSANTARTRASRAATRSATTAPNEKPPSTSGVPGNRRSSSRERGARVLLLAVAVVVDAFAAAHAAEVEAQHGEALLLERLRGTEHDLEVHHPAVQRVRVADDGRGHGRASRGPSGSLRDGRRVRRSRRSRWSASARDSSAAYFPLLVLERVTEGTRVFSSGGRRARSRGRGCSSRRTGLELAPAAAACPALACFSTRTAPSARARPTVALRRSLRSTPFGAPAAIASSSRQAISPPRPSW